MPPELETVDRNGVEILAAGGPIRGVGSPPGGDFYTVEDLERIAAANRELADEIRPPNKIGHSKEQRLLRNSGLTDGETPAAGWVDGSTLRVEGEKLLADVKAIPKKLDNLFSKGAFRTRSVELGRRTSQKTQKTHDLVVTGLAWLGAKAPAVQTLDDIEALYEDQQLDIETVRVYEVGETVWNPDQGLEAIRSQIRRALNPGQEDRYWVRDIAGDNALVQEGWDDGSTAWVVPFSLEGGVVRVSPSADWTLARQEWVETVERNVRENTANENRAPSDTPSKMAELKLSEETTVKLAERLGLEGDVDEQKLSDAIEARENELAEAKTKLHEAEAAKPKDGERSYSEEEISKLQAQAAKGEQAAQRLYEMERDSKIEDAIKAGKVTPAERDKFEKLYEADEETTKSLLDSLKPREELKREYGSEGEGDEANQAVVSNRERIARERGVPVEQVL